MTSKVLKIKTKFKKIAFTPLPFNHLYRPSLVKILICQSISLQCPSGIPKVPYKVTFLSSVPQEFLDQKWRSKFQGTFQYSCNSKVLFCSVEFQYECAPTEQLEIFLCSVKKKSLLPLISIMQRQNQSAKCFLSLSLYSVGFVLNKKERR